MNAKQGRLPSDYAAELHSDQERRRLIAVRTFVELGQLSDWPGTKDRTFVECNEVQAAKRRSPC